MTYLRVRARAPWSARLNPTPRTPVLPIAVESASPYLADALPPEAWGDRPVPPGPATRVHARPLLSVSPAMKVTRVGLIKSKKIKYPYMFFKALKQLKNTSHARTHIDRHGRQRADTSTEHSVYACIVFSVAVI